MCGIFGFVAGEKNNSSAAELEKLARELFILSESRGKEASGVMGIAGDQLIISKQPIPASMFLRTKDFEKILGNLISTDNKHRVVVGHSRLVTHGHQNNNHNNQPVVVGQLAGVHNGIVINDRELWKLAGAKPKSELDTEAAIAFLNRQIKQGSSIASSVSKLFIKLIGSVSLVVLSEKASELLLATNTGSLYWTAVPQKQLFIFASEHYILQRLLRDRFGFSQSKILSMINQLKAKEGMVVNLENGASKTFSLSKNANKKRKINKSKNSKLYKINDQSKQLKNPIRISVKNKLSDLRRHDFNYQKINQLQRCSNCILPITTPNINFDQQGVCNYCREHQPIKYRGAAALRKIVAKYRSKDGLPDCLIGFSGGRDSSYGLHFLKKELGLNPIAFTYDWGMVSDLGRRNQARMVGKLGVEHMLVAADIERNRGHIRQNILAWMNKPDLGMVPLFMQGDKVAEYYINRAAKRLGIKLVIFCRGNEFEKEEFKAGYAGVKDADPGGVIHDYSLPDKLRLLSYYGKQFLQNPAYLNGSLLNSLAGYWVTYMQQHDYLYLWHYLPWDEQQIIDTLRSEYDWETAEDTTSTWRIDDGSPAFYNYIYYQLQGFTEHDSFRSRQIREGVLSREEALNLVGEENQPRYEMLRWYFDVVGLDGHQVLQAVDQAPRRY